MRLAAALVLVSSLAWAQDGGVVLDAPRVIHLPNNHYDFNDPAFDAVDAELKRLQGVERAHKAEPSWATPVLVGLVIGVVVGGLAAIPATLAVKSALDAKP